MARFIEVIPETVSFGKFTAGKKYEVLFYAPGSENPKVSRGIKVADDTGREFYLLESYIAKIYES